MRAVTIHERARIAFAKPLASHFLIAVWRAKETGAFEATLPDVVVRRPISNAIAVNVERFFPRNARRNARFG
jgi:hypothetical protein